MDELIKRLNRIPGSYYGFVVGIETYAKKNPERLKRIMEFIDSNDNLTPSDIVKFVMDQPDFHDDGVGMNNQVATI